MEQRKIREYQTIRLFATLGFLTLLLVLLIKVVLFSPPSEDKSRSPALQQQTQSPLMQAPTSKENEY